MNRTNRAQAHKEIDRIFLDLLPQRGMAVREAQVRLCHDMLESLIGAKIALCDAGVGLGKTYAYLAAGILFRKYTENASERPVLISTASIALQNAVLGEYIPFLSDVMIEAGMIDRPLEAVLRKGKSHYVCDDRLIKRLSRANLEKKNERNKQALLSLKTHLDLDSVPHLSAYDRNQVSVPGMCGCYLTDCRYHRFVRNSRSPEYIIQVCNHNFFIADAIHRSAGIPSLVPDYCTAIIDEAHKLPESARQMFDKLLSIDDMSALVTGLKREQYVLAAEKLAGELKPIAHGLTEHAGEEYILTKERKAQYGKAIKTILSIRKNIGNAITPPLRSQLMDAWEMLDLFHRNGRGFILYADTDENGSPTLKAANANYAERMRECLWISNIPMILTSGTLAVRNDFTRFKEQAGLIGMGTHLTESVSPSPFDYKMNCRLYFPNRIYHKPEDGIGYIGELAGHITSLIRATHGHTLVLFNAYTVMSAVCAQVKKNDVGFPLFILARNQLKILDTFRASGNGVLFATGSVWEGMDFPGDMVSSLIIARLPFAVPDALSDYEKKKHPDLKTFIQKVAMPDMQIKLRQGFGRAIRTETDTCMISILDERSLPGRRFHAAALAALPEMSLTSSMNEVAAFIQAVKPKEYFMGGSNND
ncbi:ATP-dependent DNA helicase [Christensenella minuta]|uniref:ATP-dependent DNA helicase n=1 Tax=Christensenella minuta TaxID=626937 RepID=UPI002157A2A0|nr:ATP-dependent DNA helicase [Christensenella minuta]